MNFNMNNLNLKNLSNDKLMCYLDNYEKMHRDFLPFIICEILRRMSKINPILTQEQDWDNPITP